VRPEATLELVPVDGRHVGRFVAAVVSVIAARPDD
jgi:hypothetical protein